MSWSQIASNKPAATTERRSLAFHPFRALKQILPRRLFGRSLIIIVAPVVILQAIVTYIFFERDSNTVTLRMARGVADQIAYLAKVENAPIPPAERVRHREMASSTFGFTTSFSPGERLTHVVSKPGTALERQLNNIFPVQVGGDVTFDTQRVPEYVDVRVQVRDGVLRTLVPVRRVTAPRADLFIMWMVASSLVLLAVAILFLRNQVKPIERLAVAAENFGKGRAVPDFKPAGATEIRGAAEAFIQMRDRIERYVTQRTEMLAGVSHDLKTPLTRMRLQLALMDKTADTEALLSDLNEMERMLSEYLDFARGESGEAAEPAELGAFVAETVADAARARNAAGRVSVTASTELTLAVKRNALKRCLANLIDNALKYGTRVEVSLKRTGKSVEIAVEDDGIGIPEARREEAFRPFHRLDEGRNLQSGGVGLGLAIARDIARAHGGDVSLGESPLGGLKATLRLPV
jgi:two-component system, OmpR family, osmolarity sensor histidine kinase EnvZ